MKHRTVISISVAVVLALTSMSIHADQGKGSSKAGDRDQKTERGYDEDHAKGHDKDKARDSDKDLDHDRLQTQDPTSVSDKEIYGSELMSPEERNRYREQLQQMNSEEERLRYQAQHQKKMDARAKALQREVEEAE